MAENAKPLLIFDGKCGFCRIWVDYWRTLTGEALDYAASQDVGAYHPSISKESFSKSVQLVMPSGEVISGARAVFETLAMNGGRRWPLTAYESVPGFATATETAYRIIAAHRNVFYWITVLLFGKQVRPLRFDTVQWAFVKVLASVALVAFVSFGVQAKALIGSRGVEPVEHYLETLREVLGAGGWYQAPSLFWFGASDSFVHAVWICGAICSVLALAGIFWRGALFGALLCYLSLLNGSQVFLSYQWDILLLEILFLSLFLGQSRIIVWLFRWLLFRLMFLSGAVKLLSGDPTWRNLTALTVHFETQPIPTPPAWYAHQAPAGLLKASCLLVLVIELLIPFLALCPRRLRAFAAPWLIGLQSMILLTGNYAFFNWLSIALCLFLFDDAHLARIIDIRPRRRLTERPRVALAAGVVIGVLSALFALEALRFQLPSGARALVSAVAPFGITSSYGLFANMTTIRPEIVIEGSNDGTTWLEYEFRYKPGRLDRRPPWVAPHQPRLDWQMWFAALGTYRENPWFLNLLARLLRNERDVVAQLERNPFGDTAPKYVRATLYQYHFATAGSRDWWVRKPLGLYVPPISTENLR